MSQSGPSPSVRLEVLKADPPPGVERRPNPLLFVHGAFAGAWCYRPYFLPWFAARGWAARAFSLRGHGNSSGAESLASASVEDYLADLAVMVERVSEDCGAPPVLVGHSMGGFLVQHHLTRPATQGTGAGMILLAAVPPSGLWGPSLHMMMSDPWLLANLGMVQLAGPGAAVASVVARALFPPGTDPRVSDPWLALLGAESRRAPLEMLAWPAPDPTPVANLPRLSLGGGADSFVSSRMVAATGLYYNCAHHVFPDMGHGLMFTPGWQAVATTMADWLRDHDL
ncbi:alpha/beta hydrolase [Roseospirillum parvum]|uniref:Lysophospholipase, alpha-beta hydrolase superfamily n=1 Tax=Roseospirillum parvum TaxID=83401 RepID=A0A1G7Z6G4_9PROT|nr:alpha/beta fold hydrolase [Roseospirillum parvum]SDH04274.1 Lysophospholipase, alpha-beta hydrolase superfamily [Roseospirillum parvum]